MTLTPCIHCQTPSNRGEFCCSGCETVYTILKDNGLGQFYALKDEMASFTKASPVKEGDENYGYLDTEAFRKNNCYNNSMFDFFVTGIHCAACVWLLEKLPTLCAGLVQSRLSLHNAKLTLTLKEGGKLSEIAKVCEKIGYPILPFASPEASQAKEKENKAMVLKMGIAGACMGNIMLFSIAQYAGVTGPFLTTFMWLSFGLILPVMGFCALPFYKSAYASLKGKQVNIDLPVVIVIILGFIASVANLIQGSSHVYFDSISAFVFLLLTTRYSFKRAIQTWGSHKNNFSLSMPVSVEVQNNDQWQSMPLTNVRSGQIIRIKPHTMIPVDGVLLTEGHLDTHILTGESQPQLFKPQSDVYAGMKNGETDLLIKVTATGDHSRLGRLVQAIDAVKKPRWIQLADTIAHYFLLITIALAAVIFTWDLMTGPSFQPAFNKLIAFIMIACPCALSLATPMVLNLAYSQLSRQGIYIQNDDIIEKLHTIRTIYLDKTGTLTSGQMEVSHCEIEAHEKREDILAIIYALEAQSKHPIAKALKRYTESFQDPTRVVTQYKETTAKGVSGHIKETHYEVRGVEDGVGLFKENRLIATFYLSDSLVPGTKEVISDMKKKGFHLELLSGDSESIVKTIQDQCDIPHARHRLMPEDKARIISKTPFCMMVGDGANDALALKKATVGMAVQGSLEISMKAADIYCASMGIAPLPKLFSIAKRAVKTIKFNLALSLTFNAVGMTAVAVGVVSPLFAAILMPMSALTVLIVAKIAMKDAK